MEGKSGNRKSKPHKQILTALVATVPTFTYGIQIGWLSPYGPLLKSAASPTQLPLTPNDVMWMAAALPLAAICGIPFFSYASDRFGRKSCIMALSVLSSISWTIKLIATTSTAFIAARVVAGLAASGCFIVVPVYIREISEDSWRGTLGSLVMTICKVGVIAVYAFGMTLNYTAGQALYLGICVCHVLVFAFMPESPNFLVKVEKRKEATKALAWLRALSRHDEQVTSELARLKQSQSVDTDKITLLTIVRDRPTFSALRMTLVLMAMQTLSGCFALMNYAADVFRRAGTDWSADGLALFMGSLQLAGSFFTTMSIEKFGRKIPLATSSFLVGVCMFALGTCFLLGGEGGGGATAAAAVCVAILAYGGGLAPVPMVVMAEVFTFELRSRMAGASMAFSFLCSSLTVLFYTPVANLAGLHVVFYTFGAVCLSGVLYTILFVPETRGKTLEDIRGYWKKEARPEFV